MKILVTGATGRLGRHFVTAFLRKRPAARFRFLVRDRSKAPASGDVVELDLARADQASLEEACCGVDIVVHLAALVDFSANESEIMLQNYEATKKLIDAAKTAGVKRFVFCSSTAVFKKLRYLPADEKHPYTPTNAYGRSKQLAEEYLKKSGIEYVILRPATIYGPGFMSGFEGVVGAIGRGKMKIVGSGNNHIPLVHVDDVAEAFILAIRNENAKNEDFNLVGDESLTQRELFGLVAKKLDVAQPSRHVPVMLAYVVAGIRELEAAVTGSRPKMMREYVDVISDDRVFSNEKAKKMLGFSPQVTVELGIGEFIRSLRQPEKKP